MEPHFPMVKSNRATRLLGSPGWFVHQLQISLVGLKPRTDRGMEKPGMGWVAHLLGCILLKQCLMVEQSFIDLDSSQCHVSCCCFFARWIRGTYTICSNTEYILISGSRFYCYSGCWVWKVYIIWMDFVLTHQRYFCALESQGGAQSWFTSLN